MSTLCRWCLLSCREAVGLVCMLLGGILVLGVQDVADVSAGSSCRACINRGKRTRTTQQYMQSDEGMSWTACCPYTYTHSHAHTHTHTRTYTHTLSLSLFLSITHSLTYSHVHTHVLSHTYEDTDTDAHTHMLFHTHAHIPTSH